LKEFCPGAKSPIEVDVMGRLRQNSVDDL
jgi:hypothetical protein